MFTNKIKTAEYSCCHSLADLASDLDAGTTLADLTDPVDAAGLALVGRQVLGLKQTHNWIKRRPKEQDFILA